MNKAIGTMIAGAFIAIGISVAAFLLAQAARDFKSAERYVTVKGLVERDVAADTAVWTLKFRTSSEVLSEAQQLAASQKGDVLAFLKDSGIDAADITSTLRVIDRRSQDYVDQRAGLSRYVVENSLLVRTKNVDAVIAASQRTAALVDKNIVLAEDNTCTPGPTYNFTGLNDIKPQMLAEATQNARKAAEQFAADSGSTVGSIRRANQGVFSLSERDRVSENSDGGYSCAPATPNKKVRVVTTIDYFLVK